MSGGGVLGLRRLVGRAVDNELTAAAAVVALDAAFDFQRREIIDLGLIEHFPPRAAADPLAGGSELRRSEDEDEWSRGAHAKTNAPAVISRP